MTTEEKLNNLLVLWKIEELEKANEKKRIFKKNQGNLKKIKVFLKEKECVRKCDVKTAHTVSGWSVIHADATVVLSGPFQSLNDPSSEHCTLGWSYHIEVDFLHLQATFPPEIQSGNSKKIKGKRKGE